MSTCIIISARLCVTNLRLELNTFWDNWGVYIENKHISCYLSNGTLLKVHLIVDIVLVQSLFFAFSGNTILWICLLDICFNEIAFFFVNQDERPKEREEANRNLAVPNAAKVCSREAQTQRVSGSRAVRTSHYLLQWHRGLHQYLRRELTVTGNNFIILLLSSVTSLERVPCSIYFFGCILSFITICAEIFPLHTHVFFVFLDIGIFVLFFLNMFININSGQFARL